MRAIFVSLALLVTAGAGEKLGEIQNFQQKSNGADYIELEWSLTQDGDYTLHKYTLTTDKDFSNDVRCFNEHCTFVVDYLPACTDHDFELVPHFDGPSGDVLGAVATATGSTADSPPGAPSNIEVSGLGASGTNLTWDAPATNPGCVDVYEVCYRLDSDTATKCENTTDTSITLTALEACGRYQVTVTGVTPSGAAGASLDTFITTQDGVPGQPQNVVVGLATVDSITIQWDDPLINRLCIDRFAFSYGETHTRSLHYVRASDHEAIISPLNGCTNYTIDVFAVSSAGIAGPFVRNYAATAETEPLAPPSVIVGAHGPDSIDVVWGSDPNEKCSGSITICWHDRDHVEICESIPDGGGNNFTITDLLPCSSYDVIVSVVTPGGIVGQPAANATHTEDVQPGPVKFLRMKEVTSHEMTISYEAPDTHPQCVHEYDIEIINEDDYFSKRSHVVPYMDGTFTDLEACANYLVNVRAVTRTGLFSDWRSITTTTGGDVPSVPRSLAVEDFNQTSVKLNWWQPETNKLCVTKYRLEWTDGTTPGSTEVSPPVGGILPFENEKTVAGLAPCTDYTFTVYADADVGGTSDPATVTQTTAC